MFSKPGTGAQESRLLLKRRAVFNFTKQELGGSWRYIWPELVFIPGAILWLRQMLYLVSCYTGEIKVKGLSEERGEEKKRGERKEKREKEWKERRQNRWDAPWFGKLHTQHHFRLNLSAELSVFPVISMLRPTFRLESYCKQTRLFFFNCCFYLAALSLSHSYITELKHRLHPSH